MGVTKKGGMLFWACGGDYYDYYSYYYQLGLGDISENVLSLEQVKGPNGIGNLNNIISFDAGWEHSLAVQNTIIFRLHLMSYNR